MICSWSQPNWLDMLWLSSVLCTLDPDPPWPCIAQSDDLMFTTWAVQRILISGKFNLLCFISPSQNWILGLEYQVKALFILIRVRRLQTRYTRWWVRLTQTPDTDTGLVSQGPVSERRIISHFPNWEYLLCYVKSSWGPASCLVETLHRSQHSSVHPVPGCPEYNPPSA